LSRWFLGAVGLVFTFCVGIAQAQQSTQFEFDGFSYEQDLLFGQRVWATPKAPVIEAPKSVPLIPVIEEAQSDIQLEDKASTPTLDAKPISQADQFKLQVAVDRALSRILKLTLDYDALRTQIERNGESPDKESGSWFSFGDSDEKKLAELMALNRKQLAVRDNQLKVIQTRLDAVQARYDNENVSHLLAEKRLKVIKDSYKKTKIKLRKSGDKVIYLASQLEKNQKKIRALKIDLTNEKLKTFKEQTEAKQQADQKVKSVAQETLTVTSSNNTLKGLSTASEWIVEGLEFEEGSATIKLDSAANLDELIDYLKQNQKLHIQINGYTDSIGTAESNENLSAQRAQAVSSYLEDRGVEYFRIKALGYGERRPIASNDSEQGRAQNRRVAILVLN
jgi:outer membrane protein OmpA-like peptidoglycan-associated protein